MSSASKLKAALSVSVLAVALAAGGYCFYGTQAVAEAPTEVAQAHTPSPAMPVDVLTVRAEPLRQWIDFSGRLVAVGEVDLRAQVSGNLVEVRFEDGQLVKKGDVLAVIDPATYRAAVNQAKAELEAAKDNLGLAEKEKARAEKLVAKGTAARSTLDSRVNTFLVAKAQVNSAKAALRQAEIELNRTHVKAPITGRVSRVEITEGNFISAGAESPVLTTIVSTGGIYADFQVDEQTYLAHMHGIHGANRSHPEVPVRLELTNGMSASGYVYSVDNQIDPNTGTIRTRALFANDKGLLLPGMFAKLQLGTALKADLIVVPSQAIGTDQDRKFVYVVSDQGTVEYRRVTLGASIEGGRVVTSGLKDGDQVIVAGLMKLRPGLPVVAKQDQEGVS